MNKFEICKKCNGSGLSISNGVARPCTFCEALGFIKNGESLFKQPEAVCDFCGKPKEEIKEIRGPGYVATICKDCERGDKCE